MSLSVAYNMKKKSKKMAKGGEVSASDEKRPSPETKGADAKDISQNSSKKPSKDDSWTDKSTEKQAQKPSKVALSSPRMSPITGPFSVRDRQRHELEADMIRSIPPSSPKDEPPMQDDEEDASKEGPSVPALAMEMMAEGGEVGSDEEELEHAASIAAAIMAKRKMMAEGGEVEIEENNEEQPNDYYSRNKAALKENYDEDMMDMSQPEDSNEHGDSREDDEQNIDDSDIIQAIRNKMKMKSAISK